MTEFNPAPDRIPIDRKPIKSDDEIIMFTIKGRNETVTPIEALSIINEISGVLMAYEHSGGYSEYERKYLKHLRAEKS